MQEEETENCHIWEPGPIKCLAFLLENWLQWLIDYQNRCQFILFRSTCRYSSTCVLFALGTWWHEWKPSCTLTCPMVRRWLPWNKIRFRKEKKSAVHITVFGTIQSFFFWLFLLGGSLNWTMLKYINVPKKCRKAVEDTNIGNKSGRCVGGTRATVTTLRPAMAETLM